ncbi:MAG: hypothetical protein ACLUUO_08135 [Sellimonas intestinalis]
MKITKGMSGYIRSQKKKRILITILLFGISIAVLLAGHLTTAHKEQSPDDCGDFGMPACRQIRCKYDLTRCRIVPGRRKGKGSSGRQHREMS